MNFSEKEQLAVDTFNELKDQVKYMGLHNFEREKRDFYLNKGGNYWRTLRR